MIIAPAALRSGAFVCIECDARILEWITGLGPVGLKVGDYVKEACPRCRLKQWFRLAEVVDVPLPETLPPTPGFRH